MATRASSATTSWCLVVLLLAAALAAPWSPGVGNASACSWAWPEDAVTERVVDLVWAVNATVDHNGTPSEDPANESAVEAAWNARHLELVLGSSSRSYPPTIQHGHLFVSSDEMLQEYAPNGTLVSERVLPWATKLLGLDDGLLVSVTGGVLTWHAANGTAVRTLDAPRPNGTDLVWIDQGHAVVMGDGRLATLAWDPHAWVLNTSQPTVVTLTIADMNGTVVATSVFNGSLPAVDGRGPWAVNAALEWAGSNGPHDRFTEGDIRLVNVNRSGVTLLLSNGSSHNSWDAQPIWWSDDGEHRLANHPSIVSAFGSLDASLVDQRANVTAADGRVWNTSGRPMSPCGDPMSRVQGAIGDVLVMGPYVRLAEPLLERPAEAERVPVLRFLDQANETVVTVRTPVMDPPYVRSSSSAPYHLGGFLRSDATTCAAEGTYFVRVSESHVARFDHLGTRIDEWTLPTNGSIIGCDGTSMALFDGQRIHLLREPGSAERYEIHRLPGWYLDPQPAPQSHHQYEPNGSVLGWGGGYSVHPQLAWSHGHLITAGISWNESSRSGGGTTTSGNSSTTEATLITYAANVTLAVTTLDGRIVRSAHLGEVVSALGERLVTHGGDLFGAGNLQLELVGYDGSTVFYTLPRTEQREWSSHPITLGDERVLFAWHANGSIEVVERVGWWGTIGASADPRHWATADLPDETRQWSDVFAGQGSEGSFTHEPSWTRMFVDRARGEAWYVEESFNGTVLRNLSLELLERHADMVFGGISDGLLMVSHGTMWNSSEPATQPTFEHLTPVNRTSVWPDWTSGWPPVVSQGDPAASNGSEGGAGSDGPEATPEGRESGEGLGGWGSPLSVALQVGLFGVLVVAAATRTRR